MNAHDLNPHHANTTIALNEENESENKGLVNKFLLLKEPV